MFLHKFYADLLIRSPISVLVTDLASGSVVRAGSGIAILSQSSQYEVLKNVGNQAVNVVTFGCLRITGEMPEKYSSITMEKFYISND